MIKLGNKWRVGARVYHLKTGETGLITDLYDDTDELRVEWRRDDGTLWSTPKRLLTMQKWRLLKK